MEKPGAPANLGGRVSAGECIGQTEFLPVMRP